MGKVKDYYLYDEQDELPQASASEWLIHQLENRKPYLRLHPSEFGPDVLQKLREVATISLDDEDIPF